MGNKNTSKPEVFAHPRLGDVTLIDNVTPKLIERSFPISNIAEG